MDNRQQRTMQSFISVLTYLDQHPISPAPPLLTGMRKKLEASIQRIRALQGAQMQAKLASSGNVEALRRKIRRERLIPLVRIAKPLLRYASGEDALVVPHARADAKTVSDAAMRIAKAVTPHAKLLKSAGYSKSFLTELKQEATVLALASRKSDQGRRQMSVATANMAAEFKKAMLAVGVIEGLVMLHVGNNRHAMALWRNRRRVSARMGRPKLKRLQTLAP
jgi:hypothetical protein